jgi:ribosome assembly protein SQT1
VSSHELGGHTDTVTAVGFNWDGSLCLTGGYDGVVRVWDVATGSERMVLEGPEDIEWAQWHSKGNAIIAGSRDGTAWMWMAHDGSCMQVFAGHDGDVSCGTFTADGKSVCTGGADGTVRVWSPKNGSCKHVFQGPAGGFDGMVTSLVGSPDGTMLLAGNRLLFSLSPPFFLFSACIIFSFSSPFLHYYLANEKTFTFTC